MMHVVPSCASPNYFSPNYSPDSPPEINFEFDLDLLPSSDCADVVRGLDLPLPLSSDPLQEVPSPSSSFSCLDSNLHSPTMFSPAGNEKPTVYTSYVMTSSPISLPPSSPYSPGTSSKDRQFSALNKKYLGSNPEISVLLMPVILSFGLRVAVLIIFILF